MNEKQVVPLTYGELMLLTEGHGTTPIYEHIGALAAELATVKAERDDWKRKYDIVHDDPDYATCCQRRDHWKQEAVWAAKWFMKERECFFQVSYMGHWEEELAKDIDYQRAKGIVEVNR